MKKVQYIQGLFWLGKTMGFQYVFMVYSFSKNSMSNQKRRKLMSSKLLQQRFCGGWCFLKKKKKLPGRNII